MKRSTLVRSLAAAALAVSSAVAIPAQASAGTISEECIVSRYNVQTMRAWCGKAAPLTYFRITVTCRNYSGGYYYTKAGTWETQGGTRWSYGVCNGSDPALDNAQISVK